MKHPFKTVVFLIGLLFGIWSTYSALTDKPANLFIAMVSAAVAVICWQELMSGRRRH